MEANTCIENAPVLQTGLLGNAGKEVIGVYLLSRAAPLPKNRLRFRQRKLGFIKRKFGFAET